MRALCWLMLFLSGATTLQGATLLDVARVEQIAPQLPKAKIRVINLWATWCQPCVAEMPDLAAIDARYRDSDVALLGISMDDVIPGDRNATRAKVGRFLDDRKIGFRNLYFTGKATALQEHFDFEGEIPVTIVVDARGKELLRHQGRIERTELVRALDRFLKKK